MEIQNPKPFTNGELLAERVLVFRELARLTTYMGLLNEESAYRCPEDQEADITPFRHLYAVPDADLV